jgi:hypothetical protein
MFFLWRIRTVFQSLKGSDRGELTFGFTSPSFSSSVEQTLTSIRHTPKTNAYSILDRC